MLRIRRLGVRIPSRALCAAQGCQTPTRHPTQLHRHALTNGPLRPALTPEDAATYSALSNPNTYALLVDERGWSADKFEQWLGESIELLLLPA